ncbi:cell envelope integrity protein TolA [Bordetella pseudohinzii]|nr:cell envelope integrity protein TolA [Bordetella pseudohinzii]KXA78986.1 hypothetical protein AW878_11565 [Bordetella pseudohinzii]CUI46468.1 Uncharacterised protein [Bordetella pseudohinzii]
MTTQTSSFAQPRIPIFRAGTHVASDGRRVTITVADLQEIADTYDPTVQRAPHVIGHPELDDPAWGWAKSLTVDGEYLVVESEQIEVNFAQMVNEGRFPNRSASFYLPDTPGNPKPGKKYIKHIGWLGAAPPAVTGLPAVKFSADSKALSFSFPADFAGNPKEPSEMDKTAEEQQRQKEADLAAREAKLKQDEERVAQGQQALEKQAKEAARSQAVQFAQALAKDGKLLPAEVEPVVELLLVQPNDSAPLSFSQAGTQVSKPASTLLRDLLKALPSRIDYREKSPDNAGSTAAISFAAPAGVHVDTTRTDLHARATQFQAKNPSVSWLDAVKAVGG